MPNIKRMICKHTPLLSSSWRHILACPIRYVPALPIGDLIPQSLYFLPWGKLRNNNYLRNVFIKAKEDRGLFWENNANILKNKKWIANVIVGQQHATKLWWERQLPHNMKRAVLYLTVLFDLLLVFSQYCFSTHEILFSEKTEVKRKIKHILRITSKGTEADAVNKPLWFIKEHYVGRDLRDNLFQLCFYR